MMVIPGAGKRTRALGIAVLTATFLVGGLAGMAMQQTRATATPVQALDDGVLRLPDASGNLRACPPPRQRFEPLDSIGASAAQQDSIERIIDLWRPKLRTALSEFEQVQDSLFAAYERRADAVRDSMQAETRAVLTTQQREALLALYARRDSTYKAVREDQRDFERRCREARRQARGDHDGAGDAPQKDSR